MHQLSPQKLLFSIVILMTSFVASMSLGIDAVHANTIPFQGRLLQKSGIKVADTCYAMTFRLYTSTSSAAAPVWTETYPGSPCIRTKNGVFTVYLGARTALSGINFSTATYYLGISVGTDSEMTPRFRVGGTGYAFNSLKLNNLASTDFTLDRILQNGTTSTRSLSLTGTSTLTVGSVSVTGSTLQSTSTTADLLISSGRNATIRTTAANTDLTLIAARNIRFDDGNTGTILFSDSGNTTLPTGTASILGAINSAYNLASSIADGFGGELWTRAGSGSNGSNTRYIYPTLAGNYGSTGLRITDTGNVLMNGALTVDSTSTLTGAVAVASTLNVSGVTTLTTATSQNFTATTSATLPATTVTDLIVNGNSNLGAVDVGLNEVSFGGYGTIGVVEGGGLTALGLSAAVQNVPFSVQSSLSGTGNGYGTLITTQNTRTSGSQIGLLVSDASSSTRGFIDGLLQINVQNTQTDNVGMLIRAGVAKTLNKGIQFDASGSILTGIDLSDADIGTGIALGQNEITFGDYGSIGYNNDLGLPILTLSNGTASQSYALAYNSTLSGTGEGIGNFFNIQNAKTSGEQTGFVINDNELSTRGYANGLLDLQLNGATSGSTLLRLRTGSDAAADYGLLVTSTGGGSIGVGVDVSSTDIGTGIVLGTNDLSFYGGSLEGSSDITLTVSGANDFNIVTTGVGRVTMNTDDFILSSSGLELYNPEQALAVVNVGGSVTGPSDVSAFLLQSSLQATGGSPLLSGLMINADYDAGGTGASAAGLVVYNPNVANSAAIVLKDEDSTSYLDVGGSGAFGNFTLLDGTSGGLNITGSYDGEGTALRLFSHLINDGDADPAIVLGARGWAGTPISIARDTPLVAIRNNTTDVFRIRGDGTTEIIQSGANSETDFVGLAIQNTGTSMGANEKIGVEITGSGSWNGMYSGFKANAISGATTNVGLSVVDTDFDYIGTDGDVDHGISSVVGLTIPTSTYGFLKKYSGTDGGLVVGGLEDAGNSAGLILFGVASTGSSTTPAVEIVGQKKMGSSITELADTDMLARFGGNTGDEGVIIMGNGFVGIGDSTPASKLEVAASSGANYAARFLNSYTSGYGLLVQAGDFDGIGTNTLVQFQDGDGGDVGEITFTGSTTTYGTTSDARVKKDITTTQRGLMDVLRIPVRDYRFRTDKSGKLYTGFIAQELDAIVPEAVAKPTSGDGYWSVDYGKLTPLLVKAVQDQQNEMRALRESFASSEARISIESNDQISVSSIQVDKEVVTGKVLASGVVVAKSFAMPDGTEFVINGSGIIINGMQFSLSDIQMDVRSLKDRVAILEQSVNEKIAVLGDQVNAVNAMLADQQTVTTELNARLTQVEQSEGTRVGEEQLTFAIDMLPGVMDGFVARVPQYSLPIGSTITAISVAVDRPVSTSLSVQLKAGDTPYAVVLGGEDVDRTLGLTIETSQTVEITYSADASISARKATVILRYRSK